MFGSLGGPEIVLIFVVALLVFGPKRLPEIGQVVGKVVRDLRRATFDFRSSVEKEIGFDPVSGMEGARRARRDVLAAVSEPIREVAQGTLGVVRETRDAARSLAGEANPLREAVEAEILPPDPSQAQKGVPPDPEAPPALRPSLGSVSRDRAGKDEDLA